MPAPSAEVRKAELYDLVVTKGVGHQEALERLGFTNNQYEKWRQRDPAWAARYTTGRLARKREASGPPPGTFQAFVDRYFPDRRPHLAHQIMLVDALENLKENDVCLFLIWPEAGKSSTLEDYICWRLALDPDHRFRIVSQSQEHAKRMVGFIQGRMTSPDPWELYQREYGPFFEKGQDRRGKPWSTEQFTVHGSSGTERDRSLVASSWTSATYGSRIDTAIFDDVQSPENYTQAEKMFAHIRGTFFSRGLGIKTVFIGTRVGPGDLYERMMDAGIVTKTIILPAAGGMGTEAGTPTVPEWWMTNLVHDGGPCCPIGLRKCPRTGMRLTAQEFMELKKFQTGTHNWHSMYQQNPVPDELSTFSAALEACLDVNRLVGSTV